MAGTWVLQGMSPVVPLFPPHRLDSRTPPLSLPPRPPSQAKGQLFRARSATLDDSAQEQPPPIEDEAAPW